MIYIEIPIEYTHAHTVTIPSHISYNPPKTNILTKNKQIFGGIRSLSSQEPLSRRRVTHPLPILVSNNLSYLLTVHSWLLNTLQSFFNHLLICWLPSSIKILNKTELVNCAYGNKSHFFWHSNAFLHIIKKVIFHLNSSSPSYLIFLQIQVSTSLISFLLQYFICFNQAKNPNWNSTLSHCLSRNYILLAGCTMEIHFES